MNLERKIWIENKNETKRGQINVERKNERQSKKAIAIATATTNHFIEILKQKSELLIVCAFHQIEVRKCDELPK